MRSAKHFTCTRSATLITNVYVLSYSVLMRGRYWVFMGVKVAEIIRRGRFTKIPCLPNRLKFSGSIHITAVTGCSKSQAKKSPFLAGYVPSIFSISSGRRFSKVISRPLHSIVFLRSQLSKVLPGLK